ncbi:two-component system nitrogen regulation sensor histidine kinase NtrY [Amaricoccus macauensis]|uniref:histidine kinase n=1 Tax=Amaricoccus macauensis TaxID=57001 RepID=A0A840SRF5_9RHOB|nr:PAS domain-containing sensor histidine kinase [Amaricoccus macauensis]MBB5223350.1 two-component system nitrogen regulation sensor histidine kinase NtrY [Amaricoccus macauensis]
MRSHQLTYAGLRLARWRNRHNLRQATLWIMVALGPLLAIATMLVLSDMQWFGGGKMLRPVLLADFVYAIIVAAFVAQRVGEMIAARRRKSAGSKLHMRLVRFFTLIALIPTVLVAVFATATLNFGLEGWFSDRVHDVVTNSMAAAQAYEEEHRTTLQSDAQELGGFLDEQKERNPLLAGGQLRDLLTRGQLQMQRALPKAYVIDGDGGLRARGERSYLFWYTAPTPADMARAREGETVIIQDWENNEFWALLRLKAFPDHYLYVSREVDGKILSLLDETQETVRLYQQLEADRGRLLFEFALVYLGFALVVILAAMWMGLWFAERLARPVGRLASAAERVGRGDLDAKVREEQGDDEIALLGRTFNEMTRQVKGQRDALIAANDETERRRRLFDSVLSGVTAGVIGLDGAGRIEVMNAAAGALLDLDPEVSAGEPFDVTVPEFAELLHRLDTRRNGVAQAEVKLVRAGQERDLLVRIAARTADDGRLEGFVVSFDDVTDLVVAQRMAAWGDVARRIAHEVKNPLTPIQLSAERLRRKFGPMVPEEERAGLEQYADVIVRQTNDLRRIVDEFSKFARMPAPERRPVDLGKLLSEAVLLQESARPDVIYRLALPETPVLAHLDGTMINQAFTNLLKNAAEAIEERLTAASEGAAGEIRVSLMTEPGQLRIDIQDNGIGLPEQPARLFEPYVTHRAKGTGLGLPIVKKIVEEHDGTLDLVPAPPFEDGAPPGAWARMVLPQAAPEHSRDSDEKAKITEKLRESL